MRFFSFNHYSKIFRNVSHIKNDIFFNKMFAKIYDKVNYFIPMRLAFETLLLTTDPNTHENDDSLKSLLIQNHTYINCLPILRVIVFFSVGWFIPIKLGFESDKRLIVPKWIFSVSFNGGEGTSG